MSLNPIFNVDPNGDFKTKFGAWFYSKTHKDTDAPHKSGDEWVVNKLDRDKSGKITGYDSRTKWNQGSGLGILDKAVSGIGNLLDKTGEFITKLFPNVFGNSSGSGNSGEIYRQKKHPSFWKDWHLNTQWLSDFFNNKQTTKNSRFPDIPNKVFHNNFTRTNKKKEYNIPTESPGEGQRNKTVISKNTNKDIGNKKKETQRNVMQIIIKYKDKDNNNNVWHIHASDSSHYFEILKKNPDIENNLVK